jgi:hypothetical protein
MYGKTSWREYVILSHKKLYYCCTIKSTYPWRKVLSSAGIQYVHLAIKLKTVSSFESSVFSLNILHASKLSFFSFIESSELATDSGSARRLLSAHISFIYIVKGLFQFCVVTTSSVDFFIFMISIVSQLKHRF